MRFRPLGRGTAAGGLLATVILHAAIGGILWYSQTKEPPSAEQARDVIVTTMVSIGKPREKFWLPRIVQPPKPKAPEQVIKVAEDPTKPPPPREKEPPRPEDPKISKDLQRALRRAQALSQDIPEEPPEGSLTGSEFGTSTTATVGDAYATSVVTAIRQNWVLPTGLVSDSELQSLEAEIQINISADGTVTLGKVIKSSGNNFFDDSCAAAVKATRRVDPPPPGFRKGMRIQFSPKDKI